ncbi:hypothetical protein FTX61_04105 [Nitriliruptoraceae bacterium ZYF776]|nr:hypothetical protein [Profundirhabdus halotolerans]
MFASEDAFREELAARLLAPERFTDPSLMAAAFEAVADGPAADDGTTDAAAPSLSRTITQLADVEFARVQDLPAVLVELSSAAFCRNPVIGELVAGHLQASAAGVEGEPGLEALYERVLAAHGLRRRPGVRPDDLVVTFNALLTGFTYLHRVLPDGVRDDVAVPEGPRSLLSLAVEGALRQLTEPLADEGGHPTPARRG